ncbi:MAG: prepilin-type N-terminal cleavage/methylation domain-containing protein [Campylobacterota bacterium]|nr:prepilin-type N-terminal cleavage/methylation domain-containing protein [Campylobacterota bacterium]
MKPNLKKGFSLIELIFVIAILGIIAAVAVPKLLDSRSEAVISTIKQDVATISSSIQSYHMINGSISKITDAVNVNTKTWVVNDLELQYNIDNENCIKMVIESSKLNITVNSQSSDLCKKISDAGVETISYDLY